MVNVKFLTPNISFNGKCHVVNETADVPNDRAAQLVEQGHAEFTSPPPALTAAQVLTAQINIMKFGLVCR